MADRFWSGSQNTLFVTVGNQPRFLPDVTLSKVEWVIGDPKEGVKATAVLHGIFPNSNTLLSLEDRIDLEVLRHEHGRIDLYVPEKVIARFSNCKVLGKWIDDLVTHRQYEDQISLSVKLEANFKVVVE